MNNVWIWFCLSCKRYLKKISFLLLFAVFPLACLGISSLEEEPFDGVQIAVFAESGLAKQAAEKLYEKDGMIRFYSCESKEELVRDTASGKAECGFYLPEDLKEKLDGRNQRRAITVYQTESTVMDGFAKEAVTAAVMECYSSDVLLEGLKEAGFSGEDQVLELFEEFFTNGSTFSVVKQMEGKGLMPEEEMILRVFPVRGLTAVFIMAVGLFAGARVREDEKKGLFQTIPYNRRQLCMAASAMAPVFLGTLSGYAALVITKTAAWEELWKEGAVLLLYSLLAAAYGWGMQKILRNPMMICSLIPFFILGSLVFCPVFMDMSRFLPAAGWAGYFFLPWYYLVFF